MLPCKLGLTGLKLHGIFGFLALAIIFLSRTRLSEPLFLYGIIGFLRIPLGNGCCCTKCDLLIRIFYKVWGFGLLNSIVGQLRKGLELYYK